MWLRRREETSTYYELVLFRVVFESAAHTWRWTTRELSSCDIWSGKRISMSGETPDSILVANSDLPKMEKGMSTEQIITRSFADIGLVWRAL